MLEGKPGTELCSGSSLADEVGKKLMEFPQLAQLGERRLPSRPKSRSAQTCLSLPVGLWAVSPKTGMHRLRPESLGQSTHPDRYPDVRSRSGITSCRIDHSHAVADRLDCDCVRERSAVGTASWRRPLASCPVWR